MSFFSITFWLTSLYIIGGIAGIVFFGEIFFSKDKKKDDGVGQWLKTLSIWSGVIFGLLIILSYFLKFSKDLKSKLYFVPDVYIKTLNTWGIIIIVVLVLWLLFKLKILSLIPFKSLKINIESSTAGNEKPKKIKFSGEPYGKNLPPLSLLGEPLTNDAKVDTELPKKINSVFEDLELNVRVKRYVTGATITKFYLQTGKDVRIRNVISLKDDIAMLLSTESVNITTSKEGMILEVPNKERRPVTHREVCEKLRNTKLGELSVIVGEEVSGEPFHFELNEQPHILVAGTTGGGKSVCINTIISSLLLRRSPKELNFLLIDPKRVEFSKFSSLPHLIKPVVKGAQGGVDALKWAVSEMERRYIEIEKIGVENLYQLSVKERPFPILVIVVDELADLIMTAGAEIDDLISRLAQLGRAAGMHLILATQTPNSKVLSATIRSNIPSRIALRTAKSSDSMVIIDSPGAETLLGKGEMLLSIAGKMSLIRCQGSFIDKNNIRDIVKWWEEHCGDKTTNHISESGANNKNADNGGLTENLVQVHDPDPDEQLDESNKLEESDSSDDYEMLLRATICLEVIDNTDDEEISLPPIRNISESYNVTKYKVETLIDQLCKEGWIEKIREKNNVRFVKNKIILDKENAVKWLELNKKYLE